MGGRAQKGKTAAEGNLGSERSDHQDPRANKPGRRPKPELGRPNPAEIHRAALRHYFPDFIKWLRAVTDPRKCTDLCTYPIEFVLMVVLLMHCGQCGSRRQLGRDLKEGRMGGNIWRMVGKAYSKVVCHADTVNGVMEILDPEQIENLIAAVFDRLRRARVLDRFRFDGKLTVAVDATQVLSFGKCHCETERPDLYIERCAG